MKIYELKCAYYRLSEGGNRIVVMSIHQPRYSIYKLFDTITLMSLGNIVYHGTAGETALQYFSGLGEFAMTQRNFLHVSCNGWKR